jgi:tRNA threonylcarbamoyl adenosine modification protein (Sua5/YciO/YrdC/YwlC family)
VVNAPPPLADAAEALARGELVVLPTDTVYGLAARPDVPGATERLFRAKSRARSLTLPILVRDLAAARDVAAFHDLAERAARAWWPGPATLVLERTAQSRTWDLGDERATIAVRVPDEPLALELLRATGPLAVTSANRSGDPPGRTCEDLVQTFGEAVAIYLCRDDPLDGVASAVLDLTASPPRVLRPGALPAEAVRRFIEGQDPLLDSRTLR